MAQDQRRLGQPQRWKAAHLPGQQLSADGTGKTQQYRNRQVICGRKWTKYLGTGLFGDMWTLDAQEPRTDVISCDEFSFANAFQSAGNLFGTIHVAYSGAECVQTYVRGNADDTMTLHLRPDPGTDVEGALRPVFDVELAEHPVDAAVRRVHEGTALDGGRRLLGRPRRIYRTHSVTGP
ncbi:hypothetical protein [Streptomyces sp. NPDC059176]|uniref:hypothetical protein n=1 Tax=Streptomyces sp. NPDC059176 TaxID=3346758 RepID=UPI0036BA2CC2